MIIFYQRLRRALKAFLADPADDFEVVHEPVHRDNPLASDEAQATRRETAMSLMDEEVQGYLVVRITDPTGETAGDVAMQCPTELWPLVLAGIHGLNEAIAAESR